jgi:hypothetical protein
LSLGALSVNPSRQSAVEVIKASTHVAQSSHDASARCEWDGAVGFLWRHRSLSRRTWCKSRSRLTLQSCLGTNSYSVTHSKMIGTLHSCSMPNFQSD